MIAPGLKAQPAHLVNLPVPASIADFLRQFTSPDFSAISNQTVWTTALTIALAGSTETLLSLEAADRLDPYKRMSSPSRELRVQGIGNVVSGLIGGLPITSVVVRTAAKVEAGAYTRMSTIIHGVLLLASVIVLPGVLRLTPLACLATILIVVGFKLTKPSLYRKVYSQGWDQFLPFIVTVLGVVFTDLLTGVLVGLACGVFFCHSHESSRSHHGREPRFELPVPVHKRRQFPQQKRISQETARLAGSRTSDN